jgi:hypothetical protein
MLMRRLFTRTIFALLVFAFAIGSMTLADPPLNQTGAQCVDADCQDCIAGYRDEGPGEESLCPPWPEEYSNRTQCIVLGNGTGGPLAKKCKQVTGGSGADVCNPWGITIPDDQQGSCQLDVYFCGCPGGVNNGCYVFDCKCEGQLLLAGSTVRETHECTDSIP